MAATPDQPTAYVELTQITWKPADDSDSTNDTTLPDYHRIEAETSMSSTDKQLTALAVGALEARYSRTVDTCDVTITRP